MKRLASMEEECCNLQHGKKQQEQILFVSALDLIQGRKGSIDTAIVSQQESNGICYGSLFKNALTTTTTNSSSLQDNTSNKEKGNDDNCEHPAILSLKFPFELKPDQVMAVDAWLVNQCRGSIIYGSGTGKTEIAFECAKKAVATKLSSSTRRKAGITYDDDESNTTTSDQGIFNILILVPRIVLVEQNYKRLVSYGIPPEKIGRYFGEQKEVREITISTYHSAIDNNKRNLDIIRRANMVVFDEVHLASSTARAFGRIFDVVAEDRDKALLGLTATIDEHDPANSTIMTLLPSVRKYLIKDAVEDRRLARPMFFPSKFY
jgi:superfamily II DNA or RNA helicase